jgi:uncharacterized protein
MQSSNGDSGMNSSTGRALTGMDHLRQSITDILTTPIGSRVMRRLYGSLIPSLIDQPDNGATRVRVYAATVDALMRWEPRLRLTATRLVPGLRQGQVVLDVEGDYLPDGGRPVRLQIPVVP